MHMRTCPPQDHGGLALRLQPQHVQWPGRAGVASVGSAGSSSRPVSPVCIGRHTQKSKAGPKHMHHLRRMHGQLRRVRERKRTLC